MRGETQICPYCAKTFVGKNKQHTYCKESCRVRSHRESIYRDVCALLCAAERDIASAKKAMDRIGGKRKDYEQA